MLHCKYFITPLSLRAPRPAPGMNSAVAATANNHRPVLLPMSTQRLPCFLCMNECYKSQPLNLASIVALAVRYEELRTNPDKAFLKTFAPQPQTLVGIATVEILSRHPAEEVYLGQRDTHEWTTDIGILQASEKFRKELQEVEEKTKKVNKDEKLKNRVGPAKMP